MMDTYFKVNNDGVLECSDTPFSVVDLIARNISKFSMEEMQRNVEAIQELDPEHKAMRLYLTIISNLFFTFVINSFCPCIGCFDQRREFREDFVDLFDKLTKKNMEYHALIATPATHA